jgi:hypothetical protein
MLKAQRHVRAHLLALAGKLLISRCDAFRACNQVIQGVKRIRPLDAIPDASPPPSSEESPPRETQPRRLGTSSDYANRLTPFSAGRIDSTAPYVSRPRTAIAAIVASASPLQAGPSGVANALPPIVRAASSLRAPPDAAMQSPAGADAGRVSARRAKPRFFDADKLLGIARGVAAGLTFTKAAEDVDVDRKSIPAYLTSQGLTERGMKVAGRHAEEIQFLLGVRFGQTSAANRSASTAQGPSEHGHPLTGGRGARVDAPVGGRHGARLVANRLPAVSADLLRDIARRFADGESLRNAARAAGVNQGTLPNYLTAQGLTARGEDAAGPAAVEISELMRIGQASRQLQVRLPAISSEQLLDVAQQVAAGSTIKHAAQSAGVRRSTVGRHLKTSGLTDIGREVAGPVAEHIEQLASVQIDPPMNRGGRPVSLRADQLLNIARAYQEGGPLKGAFRTAEVNERTAESYITTQGLTELGRKAAGPSAAEIDGLIRARREADAA